MVAGTDTVVVRQVQRRHRQGAEQTAQDEAEAAESFALWHGVRPETDASVHALLERLERGVADKRIAPTSRAEARQQERGLEEALVTLRNLARRTA